MSEQGYILVRSLARAGEESVGYTEILLSRSDPEIVHQDDTFVEERVRGRGVGRALKVANARLLMGLPESAGSRILQTYPEPTNTPMLTTTSGHATAVPSSSAICPGMARRATPSIVVVGATPAAPSLPARTP
nr:GNAT family N-acetyltransferase [Microbacterium sp. PI-1]